jgi:hypothetical protein
MLTCGQEGATLKAAMRATLLNRLAAAITDHQGANNLNRGRDAFVAERPLPLQIVQQLPDDVRGALDAAERTPVLGLLIGALPPALTSLLGASRAGVTARELNDRGFARYADCMSTRRIRLRRREEDFDLPGPFCMYRSTVYTETSGPSWAICELLRFYGYGT